MPSRWSYSARSLKATALAVSAERTLRDRQPTDPPCTRMVILDLEGELFFGAAPELERYFDELREKVPAGLRTIILRMKRTRNPDIVCMELLQHFIQEMQQHVTVLLAGVRADFDQAMKNLLFQEWLPAEQVFLEDPAVVGSATMAAVRRAYELLGEDLCDACPRRGAKSPEGHALHYVI